MAKAGIGPHELDYIVVATATPDYFGFPSTACIVQDKLGAHGCAAFDIVAGCTGFIYALQVATGLLESGQGRNALVIGAEILTQGDRLERPLHLRPLRRRGRGGGPLAGSRKGGGASSRASSARTGAGPRTSSSSRRSGRRPSRPRAPMPPTIYMNGKNVYNFAVKSITVLIERIMHASVYSLDEIRWIVPHQANARIVQAAAKRLGIPEERFYMNMDEYANTSAASIPIALCEMEEQGPAEERRAHHAHRLRGRPDLRSDCHQMVGLLAKRGPKRVEWIAELFRRNSR